MTTGKVTAQQSHRFGAFVGVGQPALGYGDIILAFNKNIERISPLSTNNALRLRECGFLEDIPVNAQTLNHIMIQTHFSSSVIKMIQKQAAAEGDSIDFSDEQSGCRWLAKKCKNWSGMDILILSPRISTCIQDVVNSLNLGVPKEWGQTSYYDVKKSGNPQIRSSDFLPSRL